MAQVTSDGERELESDASGALGERRRRKRGAVATAAQNNEKRLRRAMGASGESEGASNNYHHQQASGQQQQQQQQAACAAGCCERIKYGRLQLDGRRQQQAMLAASERSQPPEAEANYLSGRGRGRRRKTAVRLIKWPLVHLCLPFCLLLLISLLLPLLLLLPHETSAQSSEGARLWPQSSAPGQPEQVPPPPFRVEAAARIERQKRQEAHRIAQLQDGAAGARRARRSPAAATAAAAAISLGPRVASASSSARSLLMPINELRVSGSKLEPPSRPTVDWSKQRPYFGAPAERNVSVELGKTAHLACKVFELGDKTVSWLRPRQNEILTAGKYTYIGDSRFSSLNENGSNEWILEIKDVGLNDSTSYECQVSTDPKMSLIINLHVLAARARIKQGENNYYPLGANIEFVCEILLPSAGAHRAGAPAQFYWYHNGDLINYARSAGAELARPNTNYTIDSEPAGQTSRLKLRNIQPSDAGNYTCKPANAEPATVRLFVKKHRASSNANRVHYSGGAYYVPNGKEAQRGAAGRQQQQQHYGLDAANAFELAESAAARSPRAATNLASLWLPLQLVLTYWLIASTRHPLRPLAWASLSPN